MVREYRSIEAARHAFDEYARLEPRLADFWELCQYAAPPSREDDDDGLEDPFAVDPFAADKPDDGWCAEDFFFEHVKSPLMLLVGAYRTAGPPELQSPKAYDTIYALLLDWALNRPCACCAERDDEPGYVDRAGDR